MIEKPRPINGMFARWGDGPLDIDEVRMDPATFGLLSTDQEHKEVHEGNHYYVTDFKDLSINNVMDFTWQMPNTTKWINWLLLVDVESETLWQLYETAVVTNPLSDAVTIHNNNRNSANTTGTTMRCQVQANLAGANADTNVTSATLLKQGKAGSGRNSGILLRSNELILKQNTLYCIRLTAVAAGYVNYDFEEYEHTHLA